MLVRNSCDGSWLYLKAALAPNCYDTLLAETIRLQKRRRYFPFVVAFTKIVEACSDEGCIWWSTLASPVR